MKTKTVKTIIISAKPGQLGNMLFLFAHFIAFGKENSLVVYAPAFEEYAGYFNATSQSFVAAYPVGNSLTKGIGNPVRSVVRKLIHIFSYCTGRIIYKLKLHNKWFSCIYITWNESLNLSSNEALQFFNSRYTFVQGWLYRSDFLVAKHKNAIVDFFKPTDLHLTNILKLVQGRDYEILIGIHIRHGDYKTFEGGKYYYTLDQYKKIMQSISNILSWKRIAFLICSNSKEKMDLFDDLNIIKGTNQEVEDLYSLSRCNYIIGPPSTFAMWASFYGAVPLYQVHDPDLAFSLNDFKVIN